MKKKLKKFVVVNIVLFLAIIVVGEFAALFTYRHKCMPLLKIHSKAYENPKEFIRKNSPHWELPKKFDYDKNIMYFVEGREYLSENSKKRPIITIGDSYTYGAHLAEKQTLAFKLHEQTARTTYNRGVSATGPQCVYRQLSDKDFKKQIPDAEYVIYTFIYDHLFRNIRTLRDLYGTNIELGYVLKNGKLVERTYPFWFMYGSLLIRTIIDYANSITYSDEIQNGLPLFLKIMEESVNQMKHLYPNSKFVFIEFPEGACCAVDYDGSRRLDENTLNNLKDLGIIYIYAPDLVGHDFCESKYRVSDKDHPSELAWDEFVPKLVEKLNL